MQDKKTLAVIIPFYNEEACIDELAKRLIALKDNLNDLEFSFVFVNDGSNDRSLNILFNYTQKYRFFKIINLSRNFGHQMAITAGLDYVDADYVAIMDADLQDPPELVKKLYEKINEGYDIVYAQRAWREGESFFKKFTARLFYFLLNKLCHINIPSNTGDFRLINRKILNVLKGMRERHRFLRGMIPWVGFKSAPIYYNREKRYAGFTKFPFRRMSRFALDAIFSFSNIPLKVAGYVGFSVVFFGVFCGIVLLYLRFFTTYNTPGITGVIIIVIIMSGVQIIIIGVIGEYIGRIFEEVKQRPLYVVYSLVNFSDQELNDPDK